MRVKRAREQEKEIDKMHKETLYYNCTHFIWLPAIYIFKREQKKEKKTIANPIWL